MNIFFLEFQVKERQQQILDEFERIHNARAAKQSREGISKRMLLMLRDVVIAMGTRLKKRRQRSVSIAGIKERGFHERCEP